MADSATHVLPAADDRFDAAALHRRYEAERLRRLRADGNAQYLEAAGELARYRDDPHAAAPTPRAPQQRTVDVLILGGGFGGLLTAAQLRQAGWDDLCILDQAADFGGTWYWNRYPGAACDTESYIYLPLLEETGYMPLSKYARAPEILAHSQRIGRHFDLYRAALFQTTVADMRWLAETARWRVRTDRGDQLDARFVVLAGGPLNRPKLPGIAGVESFRGHSFHTSRWDYAYTGGDASGAPLTGLADRRVGLIGTGATAVQCVPHIGAAAQEFFVFQRTPSAVDVRNDRPTDPAWVQGLQPGWQRQRMDNFTAVISGADFEVDLVDDGWTDLITGILLAARRARKAGDAPASREDTEALIQHADDLKMQRVRARIDAVVRNPATAEALKPWYSQFCKRPCFHDQYLPTFNRPNVHLVDTQGQGVERITERGVVVAGREYVLDCLIYGTGFEVGTDVTRRLGFEVTGRDGLTLSHKWRDGASSFHGLFTRGFPNLFITGTQQSGQSANFQHMLDEQSRHIAHVLGEVRARGLATLEADAEAEARWTATIVKYARARRDYLAACTPGYYNNEGVYDERSERNGQFWRGPTVFIRLLDEWRRDGTLPGLETTPLPAPGVR
ncbi:flavin-containing monooxygenase [Aquabacterium sp. OR-4]|uniref:flavin-containing monooxygenase n=1 Tax=Aquabacterium sp. OR-4 TaxID=2978127 RepID=UPI0028C5D0AD|nr:NAD(P)/FAD-dependent oxidoreductase [Aquabacterium sp. OR-4]MDT7838644.1 NAD(P)/FAD-dependent oxidoreductase [Aquabacterium sp. OR-4]